MDEGDRGRPSPVRQAGDQHNTFGGQSYNNAITYSTEYPQDTQARQQSYPPYNSNIMYNIPQSANQQYGSIQSYPPRQNTAIEVLSSQFSGNPQYYVPGDPHTPVGSAVTSQHHQPISQFSSPAYSQYSPATSRVQPPYSSSLSEINQHGPTQTSEDNEYSQTQPAVLDEAYSQYQTALKRTFQNMHDGRLGEAGTSLITISDWLLSNAVELGLVRDEQELHGDRTRLWNEFNTCWLSVLRKEKEMLREYLSTGQTPLPPQEFLREEFLERMGRELVRLCDNMERHGLVDYQMGVWEEEIIDALQECLGLLEEIASNTPIAGRTVGRLSSQS